MLGSPEASSSLGSSHTFVDGPFISISSFQQSGGNSVFWWGLSWSIKIQTTSYSDMTILESLNYESVLVNMLGKFHQKIVNITYKPFASSLLHYIFWDRKLCFGCACVCSLQFLAQCQIHSRWYKMSSEFWRTFLFRTVNTMIFSSDTFKALQLLQL